MRHIHSGVWGAALTALVLTASSARADNTADEADLRFERGVEFYKAKKYEDALAEFFYSNRLVRNRNGIMNIARCYEQLGRYEEAYRYYEDVLAHDPSQADRERVEESLARLRPRVALVRVESEPPGADIVVGRKDLGSRGVTPKTLALKPGKAKLILVRPGYRDLEQTVQLSTEKPAEVKAELEFIWASVALSGSPEGAELRVDRADGEAAGRLPATLKLKPGAHSLHVSAPGYLAAQLPVELGPDEQRALSVTLVPLPPATGSLVVTANHDPALVEIDGKESGFTPAVLSVPVGRHRVAVRMPDMRPFETSVEVDEKEGGKVHAELRFGGTKTTAASKTEVAAEDAPASITVLTREEIRAFGYTSLPEALRGVRGLFTSNDRMYEYLGVRGFSPPGDLNNRILVLYDGHPMNDLYAGQAYLGRENNIDLNEVERIEVVRGPVSSLFGSAAFFGVINIVPRHHLGERVGEGSGAAGSQGTGAGRGTAAYRFEQGEALVTAGLRRSKGDELFVVPVLEEGGSETLVRNRDREDAVNASARTRWRDFVLLGSFNSRKKAIPTGAFETLLDHEASVLDQRGFLEARWEHQWESGRSLAARAYYDATRYEGRLEYEEGLQVEDSGGDWVGAEVRLRLKELLGQQLTVGLEYQNQLRIFQVNGIAGVAGLDDRRSFQLASAYLVDEMRVKDILLINASVRADEYFGSFGFTVNPRLSVIAHPFTGATTKLMGGRSFRAPTAYERFYHDGMPDPATGELVYNTKKPNADLKPETILTAELEHTQEIADLRLTAGVFVNRISDLVLALEDTDGLLMSMNAPGSVRTEGAELEIRWQPARLTLVSAAYWVQRMVVEGLDDEEEAGRLKANAPTHAFSLKAMFPLQAPMLVGSAEAIYNSSRLGRDGNMRTGELFWVNLGLSGEKVGGGLRYWAGVQNLLDERSALPASYDLIQETVPTYGRTFLVQVSAGY